MLTMSSFAMMAISVWLFVASGGACRPGEPNQLRRCIPGLQVVSRTAPNAALQQHQYDDPVGRTLHAGSVTEHTTASCT